MFPEEMELPTPELKEEPRFCVRWFKSKKDPTKEIVLVYDKFVGHVVYKGKSADHKDHYPHIQNYYGKKNCDPPREIDPKLYAGLM